MASFFQADVAQFFCNRPQMTAQVWQMNTSGNNFFSAENLSHFYEVAAVGQLQLNKLSKFYFFFFASENDS